MYGARARIGSWNGGEVNVVSTKRNEEENNIYFFAALLSNVHS